MNKSIKHSGITIILLFIAGLSIFPFFWMILTSFKVPEQIFAVGIPLSELKFSLDSYEQAMLRSNLPLAYFNSIKISGLLTIGTLFTSSLAAYAFSKIRFKGSNIIFGLFIATLLIPGQVTLLPLYIVFSTIGWTDSHLPLIVPGVLINTYGVFLLRQFMVSIPDDLLEAAEMDGCGYFGKYFRIVLPLSKPALITLGLFTIIGSWNNYFGQMIYIDSPERYTVPLMIAMLRDTYSTGVNWGMIMAATTMSVIPISIVYLSVQKYFVQGIQTTGLK